MLNNIKDAIKRFMHKSETAVDSSKLTKEHIAFMSKVVSEGSSASIMTKQELAKTFDLSDLAIDLLSDLDMYCMKIDDDSFIIDEAAVHFGTQGDEYDFRKISNYESGMVPNAITREQLTKKYSLSESAIQRLLDENLLEHYCYGLEEE